MGKTNLNQLQLDAQGLFFGDTQVLASANELNALSSSGVTQSDLQALHALAFQGEDGLGFLGVARIVFDTVDPSNKTVGAKVTTFQLPAHAVIVGGFFDVNTAFTSAANTAQIAISVEAANDIQTAAAVSGAPYSTIGRKAITPKANTPESTSVKTTIARSITFTISVQDLTAGKLTLFLYFVVSGASA